MDQPPGNDVCSVCHDDFTLPCQANCSHWFCGHCIHRVWLHGSALQPCKCPICRRVITLLIPAEPAMSQRHDPESSQVLENIEKYNRLFGGGPRSLSQRLSDIPFLFRRMLRDLMNPERSLPLVFRVRVALSIMISVIYVVSPMDILPEAFLGFVGFVDDFFVLVIFVLHLAAIYRSLLLYRHAGQ